MKTLKTNFEQIPVETVKKIAKEHPDRANENESTTSETPGKVISSQEPWREVAEKLQEEKDPERIVELAETLIAKLDEEQIKKRPGAGPSL